MITEISVVIKLKSCGTYVYPLLKIDRSFFADPIDDFSRRAAIIVNTSISVGLTCGYACSADTKYDFSLIVSGESFLTKLRMAALMLFWSNVDILPLL